MLAGVEGRAICRRMSINDGHLTKKERVWAELWWTEGRTTLGHGGEDHERLRISGVESRRSTKVIVTAIS